MTVLKFRAKKPKKPKNPRKPKKPRKHEKSNLPEKPTVPMTRPSATRYCFELVAVALSQDNKDEVTQNLLTWFIVNVDQETLAKFIKWIVKKEDE